jgi:hypothetical protein
MQLMTKEHKVGPYIPRPNKIPEEHNDLCTSARQENLETLCVKRVGMSCNGCEMSSNHGIGGGAFIGAWGTKFDFFGIFSYFLTQKVKKQLVLNLNG